MKKIGVLMVIGLVAGVLNVAAKPSTLDLTAQVGKGAKAFQLKGKHSRQQLVATTIDEGKQADVSRKVNYSATPAKVVSIDANGRVTPEGDGEATITVYGLTPDSKSRNHGTGDGCDAACDRGDSQLDRSSFHTSLSILLPAITHSALRWTQTLAAWRGAHGVSGSSCQFSPSAEYHTSLRLPLPS